MTWLNFTTSYLETVHSNFAKSADAENVIRTSGRLRESKTISDNSRKY